MKIIHLGQIHKDSGAGIPSQDVIDAVVDSQIEIAKNIKLYPNAPVFAEGLTRDIVTENIVPNDDALSLRASAHKIFPQGLDVVYTELDRIQKFLLYSNGAVIVLHYLGILKNIYRTISPEENESTQAEIKAGNDSYSFKPREKPAMNCIVELHDKNPDIETIILVYGLAHDFAPWCQQYGFEHEYIPCGSDYSIFNTLHSTQNSPKNYSHTSPEIVNGYILSSPLPLNTPSSDPILPNDKEKMAKSIIHSSPIFHSPSSLRNSAEIQEPFSLPPAAIAANFS